MRVKLLLLSLLFVLTYLFVSPPKFFFVVNIKLQQLIISQENLSEMVSKPLLSVVDFLLPSITVIDAQPYVDAWLTGKLTKNYFGVGHRIFINNTEELLNAFKQLAPGDLLILADGIYQLPENKRVIAVNSSAQLPIKIIAKNKHKAIIEVTGEEGLWINSPYVEIKNIRFIGKCEVDSVCEHALHLVGNADNAVISDNIFEDFNAHIKANGIVIADSDAGARKYPNNVKIENNQFINHWVRATDNPVTPIDVVGGDYWIINHNFIADFAKSGGTKVTYGAFLKGAGNNGVISNNLVICEWQLKHQNKADIRVGLSLGGGGTGKTLCADQQCAYEHSNGQLRHNTILNCPNDVGIYLNNAKNTELEANVLLATLGIQNN